MPSDVNPLLDGEMDKLQFAIYDLNKRTARVEKVLTDNLSRDTRNTVGVVN